MKILIDGGNSGSGGLIRYLNGILAAGSIPHSSEVYLLCSLGFKSKISPHICDSVNILQEADLDSPSRNVRIKWWKTGFTNLVQQIRPDVILHRVGFIRGKVENIPRVVVVGSMIHFDWNEILRYLHTRDIFRIIYDRYRYIKSYHKADGILFFSNYTMNRVNEQVSGIKNKSKMIPHGLEDRFKIPRPSKIGNNEIIKLLYISPVHEYKFQWNVVKAVHILRSSSGMNLHLALIGGGASVAIKKLTTCISKLNASSYVTFTDFIPTSKLINEYQKADVFIFASSCENSPFILREAMGSGLPIASSDRMAMPEFLRDAGVYFDPENPESISIAIRLLIENPEKSRDFSKKAFTYALKFSWPDCSKKTFDYLEEIAMKRKSQPCTKR